MDIPKVSVVVPCYNAEKYLHQCLDSIVNQTLRDIEIICINDGSKDSTLSILEAYAQKDPRIRILDKVNTGYGNSMNCGFDLAQGEYLGIVESDDFAEPDMFEMLYNCAVQNDLDVARGGFFQYASEPQVSNIPVMPPVRIAGRKVFCPVKDLRDPLQQADFFRTVPAIWSAIYRRDFIRENRIRFNETPGASYQDVGFNFKVWTRAERVQLLEKCLLHYRTDNAQSSVHNLSKVYCVCDEFNEIERYLQEDPVRSPQIFPIAVRIRYENYLWNYERLAEPQREQFIMRFCADLRRYREDGTMDRRYFSWYAWNNLAKILLDPVRFNALYASRCRGEAAPDFYDAYPQERPIRGRLAYCCVEKMMLGYTFFREQGLRHLICRTAEKISEKSKH